MTRPSCEGLPVDIKLHVLRELFLQLTESDGLINLNSAPTLDLLFPADCFAIVLRQQYRAKKSRCSEILQRAGEVRRMFSNDKESLSISNRSIGPLSPRLETIVREGKRRQDLTVRFMALAARFLQNNNSVTRNYLDEFESRHFALLERDGCSPSAIFYDAAQAFSFLCQDSILVPREDYSIFRHDPCAVCSPSIDEALRSFCSDHHIRRERLLVDYPTLLARIGCYKRIEAHAWWCLNGDGSELLSEGLVRITHDWHDGTLLIHIATWSCHGHSEHNNYLARINLALNAVVSVEDSLPHEPFEVASPSSPKPRSAKVVEVSQIPTKFIATETPIHVEAPSIHGNTVMLNITQADLAEKELGGFKTITLQVDYDDPNLKAGNCWLRDGQWEYGQAPLTKDPARQDYVYRAITDQSHYFKYWTRSIPRKPSGVRLFPDDEPALCKLMSCGCSKR